MLNKYTKFAIFGFILLSLLGGIGVKTIAGKTENNSESPIRKIEISINKDQRELFFSQLQKFAELHGFAIRIAPTTPARENFSIEMWREDFKILGANPFDPGTFKIGIYENDKAAQEIPSSHLDGLIRDLRAMTTEIAGATFKEVTTTR